MVLENRHRRIVQSMPTKRTRQNTASLTKAPSSTPNTPWLSPMTSTKMSTICTKPFAAERTEYRRDFSCARKRAKGMRKNTRATTVIPTSITRPTYWGSPMSIPLISRANST